MLTSVVARHSSRGVAAARSAIAPWTARALPLVAALHPSSAAPSHRPTPPALLSAPTTTTAVTPASSSSPSPSSSSPLQPRFSSLFSHFLPSTSPASPSALPHSSTPPTAPLSLTPTRSFVQLRTNLAVADNSGARRVQCIKVLRGRGPNAGGLGDIIIASVKDAEPRGKVRKGEVVTCVVVRAATHHRRADGTQVRFDGPAAVVISKAGEPIGTRVFGPVPHELRRRKMLKLLTLAQHVI